MNHSRALALFFLLALAVTVPARQGGTSLDAVFIGLLPSKDYKAKVSPALGVLAGIDLPILSPLSLTARSGYVAHFERKNSWRSLVPAFGGLKINSYSTTLYLAGEAGPVLTRDAYIGSDPSRKSTSATPLAWGLGLGSAVDEHDLRVSIHIWDASHPKETFTFGLSLAFFFLGY